MRTRRRRLVLLCLSIVATMVVVGWMRASALQNDDLDVLKVIPEYTLESRILPDGQWTRNPRKLGTVYWSEASLHQVRNIGTTMSHTIRIELKY